MCQVTIGEFLKQAAQQLKQGKIEAPALEAGVMLCHGLNCSRAYLYSHDDRVLEKTEMESLQKMLEQRLQGVPMQYIIGHTEFMSLDFIVSPAVLIPRQDTEILVERCLEMIRDRNAVGSSEIISDISLRRQIEVLDLCTGSGCIAISIAHFCPECRVVACDISLEALKIAKINRASNGMEDRIALQQGDLFEALCGREEGFDLIVSNPPYIESKTILQLEQQVRDHEPGIALDGGPDGLVFYRRIVKAAPAYLKESGILAFEIGYNQAQAVKELMTADFTDISIYSDLGGNDRVVTGNLRNRQTSTIRSTAVKPLHPANS